MPRIERLISATLSALNKYIRSFEPSGVVVIHAHDKFVSNNSIKKYLYVSKYANGRVDLIHPNGVGLRILYSVLGEHFPSLMDWV